MTKEESKKKFEAWVMEGFGSLIWNEDRSFHDPLVQEMWERWRWQRKEVDYIVVNDVVIADAK